MILVYVAVTLLSTLRRPLLTMNSREEMTKYLQQVITSKILLTNVFSFAVVEKSRASLLLLTLYPKNDTNIKTHYINDNYNVRKLSIIYKCMSA